MEAPTLTTDRLILRPLALEDFEAYAVAWADPAMTRFMGSGPRDRTTSWNKFLGSAGLWSICGIGYWTFIERATGQFVGNGGLARFERGIPELEGFPEAGWALVPAAWGKGYATEAMGAALDWAQKQRTIAEVRCIIDPDNVASSRVARKLGFEKFAETSDALGRIDVLRAVFPFSIKD